MILTDKDSTLKINVKLAEDTSILTAALLQVLMFKSTDDVSTLQFSELMELLHCSKKVLLKARKQLVEAGLCTYDTSTYTLLPESDQYASGTFCVYSPVVAKELSLPQSILLSYIHGYASKSRKVIESYQYMFNRSLNTSIPEETPLTEITARRAMKSLTETSLVITKVDDTNTYTEHSTLCYRVDYNLLNKLFKQPIKETTMTQTTEHSSDFEEFFATYPDIGKNRLRLRRDALLAYRHERQDVDANTLLKAAKAYKLFCDGSGTTHPSAAHKWLKNKEYLLGDDLLFNLPQTNFPAIDYVSEATGVRHQLPALVRKPLSKLQQNINTREEFNALWQVHYTKGTKSSPDAMYAAFFNLRSDIPFGTIVEAFINYNVEHGSVNGSSNNPLPTVTGEAFLTTGTWKKYVSMPGKNYDANIKLFPSSDDPYLLKIHVEYADPSINPETMYIGDFIRKCGIRANRCVVVI